MIKKNRRFCITLTGLGKLRCFFYVVLYICGVPFFSVWQNSLEPLMEWANCILSKCRKVSVFGDLSVWQNAQKFMFNSSSSSLESVVESIDKKINRNVLCFFSRDLLLFCKIRMEEIFKYFTSKQQIEHFKLRCCLLRRKNCVSILW